MKLKKFSREKRISSFPVPLGLPEEQALFRKIDGHRHDMIAALLLLPPAFVMLMDHYRKIAHGDATALAQTLPLHIAPTDTMALPDNQNVPSPDMRAAIEHADNILQAGASYRRLQEAPGTPEEILEASKERLAATMMLMRPYDRQLETFAAALDDSSRGHQPQAMQAYARAHRALRFDKDKVVLSNMRLAVSIARQQKDFGFQEDMIQEGGIAMMKALEHYDHRRGKFSTFVFFHIAHKIAHALPAHTNLVHVPYDLLSALKHAKAFEQKNLLLTGHLPESAATVNAAGLTVSRFAEAARAAQPAISLHAPWHSDENITLESNLPDAQATNAEDYADRRMHQSLIASVLDNALNPKEQRIIRARFGLDDGNDKVLQEIGDAMSLTRERIRQIENRAVEKLKASPVLAEMSDAKAQIMQPVVKKPRKGSPQLSEIEFFAEKTPELVVALRQKNIITRADLVKEMAAEQGMYASSASLAINKMIKHGVFDSRARLVPSAALIADIAGMKPDKAYARLHGGPQRTGLLPYSRKLKLAP